MSSLFELFILSLFADLNDMLYVYIYNCVFEFIYDNDYTLLQIKERNFIDKFKPKLNKTWTVHTQKWK